LADGRVRGFYGPWGIRETPFNPYRSMIFRVVDLGQNDIGR